MEFRTVVICCKCQQPIAPGEGLGFVYFKIPGKVGYHFFHRRFRSEDCWDSYMRENRQKEERL